jgi:hypothetical protein
MSVPGNEHISILDEVKIQTQVLVPVLRALRAELGQEVANRLVMTALRAWRQRVFADVAASTPGSPRDKWAALTAASMPRIGDAIDVQVLTHEPDRMDFNVTGCRYADFFRALGEPELGAVLLCEADVDVAAAGTPEVEFARTQTIMQGAAYCDFRYRMRVTEPR